jgi:hypothetical protein
MDWSQASRVQNRHPGPKSLWREYEGNYVRCGGPSQLRTTNMHRRVHATSHSLGRSPRTRAPALQQYRNHRTIWQ